MKTLLVILAAAAVCGMGGLLYQRIVGKERDSAALYIEGFLSFFCLAGLVSLPFIKLRLAFHVYVVSLAVCAGVILLAGGFFLVSGVSEKRKRIKELKTEAVRPAARKQERLPYLLAGLVFVGILFSIFVFEPSVGSDLTAESVLTAIETDSLFEYNPATGRKLEIGIYPQSKLLILPVFYGVLYQLGTMDLPFYFFLYRLIPILVLILNGMVFWKWGTLLFPAGLEDGRERRGFFLMFYMALIWFGDYFPGIFAYRLLHEGWKGESILAVVVLPWLAWIGMDILLHGMKKQRLCGLALCFGAGIFLAEWKTVLVLESATVAFFVVLWMVRRGWQCLKQRR